MNAQMQKISFSYKDAPLESVINEIAAKNDYNILLPTGKNAIKGTLTFSYPKKITPIKAWNFLETILQSAGYSIIPQGDIFTIISNTQNPNKQPLPLYIGIDPDQLPDTSQRIRYIYFFSNINLVNSDQKREIQTILKDILPRADTKNISQQLDASINAAILSSTANRIKSAMKIIATLDQTGFAETAIVISLKHTQAKFVETLFKGDRKNPGGLLGSDKGRMPLFFGDQKSKKKRERYFSDTTRVKALAHSNQIAILGKKDAVVKVKEFIEKYVDIPLDPHHKAKSLIHVYDLNYLDAQKFAQVLTTILKAPAGVQARGKATIGGVDFSKVIIAAEQEIATKPKQGGTDSSKQGLQQKGAFVGGNRLIIAAREREWQMIKKLIEKMDAKPQPQVALDVLIVDLSTDDLKALGSQLRNKQLSPFFTNVNFQSAHLSNPWLNFDDNNTILNPPGLAADLLRPELPTNINPSLPASTTKVTIPSSTALPGGSPSPFSTPGSFFLSIGEKNCIGDGFTNPIAYLLEALHNSSSSHIISRPFVVTATNTKADILTAQNRLVDGGATIANSGPTIVNKENLQAALQVSVTPRVSAGNNVNLTLTVKSNEFVSSENNTIQNREITTNANVQDGHVLVLGGLTQDREDEIILETPLLGKIPIFGFLFKKKQKTLQKRSLVVFIVPRIIRPLTTRKYESLISPYTHDKLEVARSFVASDKYFGDAKDPISRAFFGTDADDTSLHQVDYFIERDMFKEGGIVETLAPAKDITPQQLAQLEAKGIFPGQPAPLHKKVSGGLTPAKPIPLAQQKKLKSTHIPMMTPATPIPLAQQKKSSRLKGMLTGVKNPLRK